MEYTVVINQQKSVEWGLNQSQAVLFAFVYGVPSWAESITLSGAVYYRLSKHKIVTELPLLTDKPDTAYRILQQLKQKQLIEIKIIDGEQYISLTEKTTQWNKTINKSEQRKEIRASEINPSNRAENNPGLGNKSDPSLGNKSDESYIPVKTLSDSSCPASPDESDLDNGAAEIQTAKRRKWGTPEDLEIAKEIFVGVLRVTENQAKEPNFVDWANEIRLMRERDNRQPDHIRKLFDWANKDDFWQKNILSPSKLRHQWANLAARRNSSQKGGANAKDNATIRRPASAIERMLAGHAARNSATPGGAGCAMGQDDLNVRETVDGQFRREH